VRAVVNDAVCRTPPPPRARKSTDRRPEARRRERRERRDDDDKAQKRTHASHIKRIERRHVVEISCAMWKTNAHFLKKDSRVPVTMREGHIDE
jgi:hypothetical protein